MPAGENSHITRGLESFRPVGSRLPEAVDNNAPSIAEAETETVDGQYAPPPGKPFVTDLDLKLIGTMVVASPEKSVAVITHSRSRVRETVTEGDRAVNVRVKKILINA